MKKLLPMLGSVATAKPAQIAQVFSLTGKIQKLAEVTSHSIKTIGILGSGAKYTCTFCCRIWGNFDTLKTGVYKSTCNQDDRRVVLRQRAPDFIQLPALRKAWGLNAADTAWFAKICQSNPTKCLNSISFHKIVEIPTPYLRHKAAFTCKTCTRQWNAISSAKKFAPKFPCGRKFRRAILGMKRRWWERVHPKTRQSLMKTWQLSAAEAKGLNTAPRLKQQLG